jgi:beta-phosphoglucomutase-like phosphatase (HAD superfamily)
VTAPTLRPTGVLLDMDGTLVDTEPLWFEATRTAFRTLGADLPTAAEQEMLGLDAEAALDLLRDRYAIAVDRTALDLALHAALGPALAGARERPGAGALVARLVAAGVARAIVSNSSHEVIAATLAPHAWAGALTHRYSVDDVALGKPAPDVYRYAARQLALAPEACVAIEDSVAGATAAVAAGIPCIAVAFDVEPSALGRVTPHVVASLSEALVLLGLAHEAPRSA